MLLIDPLLEQFSIINSDFEFSQIFKRYKIRFLVSDQDFWVGAQTQSPIFVYVDLRS